MREPKHAEALCSSFDMHAPMKTFIGHQAPVCPHPQPQLCLGTCACAVRHAGWEASKVVPDMVLYCQKASEDAGHSDPGPRVLMLELLTVGGRPALVSHAAKIWAVGSRMGLFFL